MTKLPVKMAQALAFGAASSSPVIMSGFGAGRGAESVGSGERGWGGVGSPLCAVKRGPPHNTDRHVDSKHKHSKTNGSRLPL